MLLGHFLGEDAEEDRHVFGPFPERGNKDVDRTKTEKKVGTETVVPDFELKVFVRGRDHPDVHTPRTGGAHPEKLAVFQNPEEFDLRGEGEFADFIQEDRPAVRKLEIPFALVHGSRKGPAFVAEQLTFNDPFGDGAAVDGNKRLAAPCACGMDRLGNDLLADTALPRDEHGDVGGRHLFDDLQNLPHGDGLAKDEAVFPLRRFRFCHGVLHLTVSPPWG